MKSNKKNFFFKINFDKCIIKTGDNRRRKTPVRPRADFFKLSKLMKTDAKQSSPSTVIDILNLSGEGEEINDDSCLE